MMIFIFWVKHYCKPLSFSVASLAMTSINSGLIIAMGLTGVLCSAGCSSSEGTPDAGESTVFVAQLSDFSGFCHWKSAPAVADIDASDGIHADAGPLTVYWNHSPPHGATQFPVGTIILKESNQANPADRTAFAMVKRQARGTGYNSSGADGWEWWSVFDKGDCTVSEGWRGPAPQANPNDQYLSTPAGDCNGCHGRIKGNDYVWDSALQLSKF